MVQVASRDHGCGEPFLLHHAPDNLKARYCQEVCCEGLALLKIIRPCRKSVQHRRWPCQSTQCHFMPAIVHVTTAKAHVRGHQEVHIQRTPYPLCWTVTIETTELQHQINCSPRVIISWEPLQASFGKENLAAISQQGGWTEAHLTLMRPLITSL